jgi:HlyD family secretion protein
MSVTFAPGAAPEDDSASREIRIGLFALAVFLAGFVGWGAIAPLNAAVVAPGVVVVSGNRQTVQHREGGVVSKLNVREGQSVAAGDVLIELSAPELLAQERAVFSQILDLQMQRARLIADATGSRSLQRPPEWASYDEADRLVADAAFARHVREAAAQGAAQSEFGARIVGYRGEIAAAARQEALLGEELEGMRSLAAEQLVPLTRVRALERGLAELQGRQAALTAQIAATQQDRSEAQRQIEARIAELSPQLVGARERLERTRLRAPVAGLVVGLTAHTVGGVVNPGERLMDIVPTGQELIVEAQVRPEDADDLEPGQRTEVRITAFGGRNLPIVTGSVRQISADRFIDEHSGRPYFLAQVAVPPDQLRLITERANGGRRLRAGLSAEVVIPTRARTALQYLFEPLDRSLWQSFREQ